MQEYYFAPHDQLVVEVGRDQWVFNPRENEKLNNVFRFLTWEDEQSPDNNEFDTMEDFYKSFNYNKPFVFASLDEAMMLNDYIFYPICKDEFDYQYEIKTELHLRPIIGYLFQKKSIVLEKYKNNWETKALQELRYYNQYINREVYFINTYYVDEAVSYKTGIYEKDNELDMYEDLYSIGCYSNIQECLENNPELYKKADNGVKHSFNKSKNR